MRRLLALAGVSLALFGQSDALLRQGRFADAARSLAGEHGFDAELLKAKLALWSNQWPECQRHLDLAKRQQNSSKELAAIQAELLTRQDRFAEAAPAYRAAGNLALAEQMEMFGQRRPYRLEREIERVDIPFVHVDPLPYLRATVNGQDAGLLLDTGGNELILDPEFAASASVPLTKESATGEYAGGNQASSQYGAVRTLGLGGWTLLDVPVNILSTRRMSAAANGKQVDGILGTALLSHFVATIDYAGGKLTLRKPDSRESRKFLDSLSEAKRFPFWMAGSHVVVSWGKVNGQGPMLFFVDTGLAGLPFTAPAATFERAGVKLPDALSASGVGGGAGRVKVAPVAIESLEFGGKKMNNVTALFGPFPENLRTRFGFEIAGIISHAFFREGTLTLDYRAMRGYLQ